MQHQLDLHPAPRRQAVDRQHRFGHLMHLLEDKLLRLRCQQPVRVVRAEYRSRELNSGEEEEGTLPIRASNTICVSVNADCHVRARRRCRTTHHGSDAVKQAAQGLAVLLEERLIVILGVKRMVCIVGHLGRDGGKELLQMLQL